MISITTGILDNDHKGLTGRGTIHWMEVDAGDGVLQRYEYGLLELLSGAFNKSAILQPLIERAATIRLEKEAKEKQQKAEHLAKRALIAEDPALITIINEVLPTQEKAISQYKAGNEKAINAIVGAVIKAGAKNYDAYVIITQLKKMISQL